MYCYKQLNENGELISLITYDNLRPNITDPLIVEITEEEYTQLVSDIEEKEILTWQLYREEITIDDIKPEWQEEIQKRVDEIIDMQGPIDEQEVSSEELIQMIEEVL